MKKVDSIRLAMILLAASSAAVTAQTGNPPNNGSEKRTAIRSDVGVAPVIPSMLEPLTSAGLFDNQLVRNMPLSAVFESETIQYQANNAPSTVKRSTTRIYRDSAGRVRREQIFYPTSTASTSPSQPLQTVITIYDPVAKYGYSINAQTRTAFRYRLPQTAPGQNQPFDDRISQIVDLYRNDEPRTGNVRLYRLEKPRMEPLGRQSINGVEAEGRRITIKVPAGSIGNSVQAESVFETWIAKDLKMLVKCIVTNPASGEHKFQLTEIARMEQSPMLFEIPSDYTVTDMGVIRTDIPPPY